MSKQINYKFDSDEERYFYDWLVELYDAGYIDWIYSEKKTWRVVDPVVCSRVSLIKTKKVKHSTFTLTKKRDYTPDFIFKFNQRAKSIFYHDKTSGYEGRPFFYCNNNRGIIYVDTKGVFARNKSDMIFPDRQSILASRYGVFAQKVIPFALGARYVKKKTLFQQTFTPTSLIADQVYKKTRVGKWKAGESKLKYRVTKLNEYVKYKTMD